MLDSPTCYVSPKLQGRSSGKEGRGLFVLEPIKPHEVLVVWGGEIITYQQLSNLDYSARRVTLQVESDLYLFSSREGPGDWVNHSCDPNAGLRGQIVLVAMRPIKVGEEVCYDYAMSEGSGYDEFDCSCGSPHCRKRICGADWQLPELQQRYANFFSPYLQRQITALQSQAGVVC